MSVNTVSAIRCIVLLASQHCVVGTTCGRAAACGSLSALGELPALASSRPPLTGAPRALAGCAGVRLSAQTAERSAGSNGGGGGERGALAPAPSCSPFVLLQERSAMAAAPQLDDLTPDALQHVLSQPLLSAADLAAVACTCRTLRRASEQVWCASLVRCLPVRLSALLLVDVTSACSQTSQPTPHTVVQDALWRLQCEAWLAAQRSARPHDPALLGLTPTALLAALQLGGSPAPAHHRALRAFLHHLGTWPGGYWFATGGLALPQGHLLLVQLHPPSGGLRLARLRSRSAAAPPTGAEECWTVEACATLAATPAGGVRLAGCGGLQHAVLQLSLEGAALKLHRDSGRCPVVAPTPGWATLASQDAPPPGRSGGSGEASGSGSGSGSGSSSGGPSSLFASMASLTAHLGLRISRFSVSGRRACWQVPGLAAGGVGGAYEAAERRGATAGGRGRRSACLPAALACFRQSLPVHAGPPSLPSFCPGLQVQDFQQYSRAPLPAPADLAPAEGEPPGIALLRRCQVGRPRAEHGGAGQDWRRFQHHKGRRACCSRLLAAVQPRLLSARLGRNNSAAITRLHALNCKCAAPDPALHPLPQGTVTASPPTLLPLPLCRRECSAAATARTALKSSPSLSAAARGMRRGAAPSLAHACRLSSWSEIQTSWRSSEWNLECEQGEDSPRVAAARFGLFVFGVFLAAAPPLPTWHVPPAAAFVSFALRLPPLPLSLQAFVRGRCQQLPSGALRSTREDGAGHACCACCAGSARDWCACMLPGHREQVHCGASCGASSGACTSETARLPLHQT